MRCKHKNGGLTQIQELITWNEVQNGVVLAISETETGSYIGRGFRCKDCHQLFPIRYPIDKNPKWLQKIINQA
jgi:hypothetical protein